MTSIHKHELAATALSAIYFFCILCAYFILRPVREAMGLRGGVDELSWLFMGTLFVTLLANPLYGALVSRFPRHIFIPVTYRFFMLNLLAFFLLLQFAPHYIGEAARRVFFVWLSVFNLFAVAVFWSFMADGFSLEQGKRLFGLIGLGGTLGAISGAALTTLLVQRLGAAAMMLISIVMLEAAVWCVSALHRRFVAQLPVAQSPSTVPDAAQSPTAVSQPSTVVGQPLAGIILALRSPYLLAISGYVFLLAIMTTFFYFAQARIVSAHTLDTVGRAAILGRIEFWSQVATLLAQLVLAGPLIRLIGVGLTLTLMAAVAAGGLAWLSFTPTLDVLVVAQVLFTAGRHGLTRPARETLFTVLRRDEKYASKAFIDTFVFRTGDVVGALVDKLIHARQFGLPGVALAALPLASIWTALSLYLGRTQRRLGSASSAHHHA